MHAAMAEFATYAEKGRCAHRYLIIMARTASWSEFLQWSYNMNYSCNDGNSLAVLGSSDFQKAEGGDLACEGGPSACAELLALAMPGQPWKHRTIWRWHT